MLRPALTPPDAEVSRRARAQISGIAIGGSSISARLEVRGDGVDLRFRLDEGDPVDFAAVIPAPPGFVVTVEYDDWDRAETVGEPLPVALTEVGEWYRLWGRIARDDVAWPAEPPASVPRGIEVMGLPVLFDAADADAPYLEGFAAACEALFPFEIRRLGLDDLARGPLPYTVDLSPRERRPALLRDLTRHLERFALGAGSDAGPR
ncbi:MAG: hypothetical protein R3F34_14995 [Planctomycetota bacterium]